MKGNKKFSGSADRKSADQESALKTYVVLMRAAGSLTDRVHAPLRAHKLTTGQFGVLEALYFAGSMRANELSGKVLLSSANVTLILDNLEKRGLVRRERESGDRRCITIHLTDSGAALIGEIFPEHAERISKAFAALSASERERLAGLLKKLGKAQGNSD